MDCGRELWLGFRTKRLAVVPEWADVSGENRDQCLATVSLSGTLEGKLRAAAEAGFAGVEIFDTDFVASAMTPGEVRALLDELGLACVLYQPFRDLEGMPDPYRYRAFVRIGQKFDVMRELGCDRILLCSNCSPYALPDRGRIVADLSDLAAGYNILVGYEALAWGVHVNDHRVAWEIVKAVGRPKSASCWPRTASPACPSPVQLSRRCRS